MDKNRQMRGAEKAANESYKCTVSSTQRLRNEAAEIL